MALAGVVLLVSGYVSSWLAVSYAASKGMVGNSTTLHMRPVYSPLFAYCNSDLPGSVALSDLWWNLTGLPSFYTGPQKPESHLSPNERW